jgi:glycosyltransferase involved in cell wall biosynthesis
LSDAIEKLAAAARLPQARPDWRLEPAAAPEPRVAVLIPCYNEEATIAKVVADFHASLPQSVIYVYDNNSSDRTAFVARAAGAVVRAEPLQGKGRVVRRMFADVEADVFILVDGDDTYDAAAAPAMLKLLLEQRLDMVTAARVTAQQGAYRHGHRLGNMALSGMVRAVFGGGVSDVLSGYRAFSRRFVKSFPALAGGFETETEFTVHALSLEMPISEIAVHYRERPAGSTSKLHTWSDGLRILRTLLVLAKEGRPLQFFATTGTILLLTALVIGLPVVMEFLRTGLVPKFPSALLATGLVLLSSLTLVCGLVLDSVERGRKELKRLAYLAIPAMPSWDG